MTQITRRSFLGATMAGSALRPLRLVLEPRPRARERQPTLVVVFLRGGADGLHLVVPHGDPAYAELRPSLAIPRPGAAGGALDLDGYFGLHPAAGALLPLFRQGLAIALPAVGHAANTRSHFEEQDSWETALGRHDATSSGWLDRHLASSSGRGPVRALALGDRLPRSLRGPEPVLSLRGLDDLTLGGGADELQATLKALEAAYGREATGRGPALAAQGGRAALEALRLLATRTPTLSSNVKWPDTSLGRRARELARLVRADLGLEICELDVDGWDTHQGQGGESGTFADHVREVAEALAALVRELEDRLDDLLIVTLTEFGRTAAENGTGGTDHGHASCVLALGGALSRERASPVLGPWPGLGREALHEGRDLQHAVDFHDLYAELLGFLGNPNVREVLGERETRAVGLL